MASTSSFNKGQHQAKQKTPSVGLIAFFVIAALTGIYAFMLAPDPSDTLLGLMAPSSTATLTPTLTMTASPSPTATYAPTMVASPTVMLNATPQPSTNTPTPLPTPDTAERERYVPILMYHYISTPPEDADRYRLDLSVTPEDFYKQMSWLSENGYTTISLYDLLYSLSIGWPPLPDNPVIITFDDGYVDNYDNAFPILQEFGFTSTFFILTDVTERQEPGYMTWDMLSEMNDAGMSIEVHGREHLSFEGRPYDWLVYHLLGPAEAIEYYLGYKPRFMAYPSGSYDADTINIVHQAGYWGAVTTQHGAVHSSQSPFELQRLRVRGDWSLSTFSAVVSGE